MKNNVLNLCGGFFDDLDKLNSNQDNDEFSDLNNKVYNEHDFILSQNKNPEFFEGLCNMCKDKEIPYNENGFTQNDLDKIKILSNKSCIKDFFVGTYFKNVTSLDELQYFNNLLTIDMCCFFNCKKLKSIIFPKNLQKIDRHVFEACIYLKKVDFSKIENFKLILGGSSFSSTSIDNLIFPKNLEIIHEMCFYNSVFLENIIFPENLQKIQYGAFANCKSLKKLIFNNNIKKIDRNAFDSCFSLEEVYIPSNIEKIGDKSFANCTSLEKIIIPERFKDNIKNIFDGVNLTKIDITYI